MLNSVRRHFQNHKPRPYSEYLAFKETLDGAKAAGLSVGDFIERTYCPGAVPPAERTILQMVDLGAFDPSPERICEVGPGSGRYLQHVIVRTHPLHYEIYEIRLRMACLAGQRASGGCQTVRRSHSFSHRIRFYRFRSCPQTFPRISFLVTMSHLREMARVVKPGGWIAFDILTENCFTPERLQAWFNSDVWSWEWAPNIVPKDFVCKLFADYKVHLADSFLVPLYPANTECCVFRKSPTATNSTH